MFRSQSLAITALLAGLGATQGAIAETATAAESRGFNTCVASASTKGLKGVSTSPTYYVRKADDRNFFYVNVAAWEGSERVSKRLRCETSTKGFKLHSVQLADGDYNLEDGSVLTFADNTNDADSKPLATAGR